MRTRRRTRGILPLMAAALTLSIGLPHAATAAQPGPGGKEKETAAVAKTHLRAAAKLRTPSGHAQPISKQKPLPPLHTDTEQQLAKSRQQAKTMKAQARQRPKASDNPKPSAKKAKQQLKPSAKKTQHQLKTSGRKTESKAKTKAKAKSKAKAKRLAPLAAPVLQNSFEGLDQDGTPLFPPDAHGAVGLNDFVEVTNGRGVGIFSKTSGALEKNVSFASFFGYTQTPIFDPRVVYDKVANRWVISAEAFPEYSGAQFYFLAVSKTSDPNGAFFIYRVNVAGLGGFFDFPQLGLDPDAVIVTANIFTPKDEYIASDVFGIGKAQLYNGLPFVVPVFNVGTPGTVAPPIVEDDSSNSFLVAADIADNTHLKLFRATGLGGDRPTVVLQSNVTVLNFFAPPPAHQPGTNATLDALDARFQNASTQIGNQLLNVHSIDVDELPTPVWYQIDTTANTVPANRSGIVVESTFSSDFNPSVVGSPVGGTTDNPIGQMFFTWTATNAEGVNVSNHHQVRVKGTGRQAADSPSIFGGETFTEASTFYNLSGGPGVERWGDYSAATIDPVPATGCPAGNRAWIVNERQTSTTLWGSRFGSLGFC